MISAERPHVPEGAQESFLHYVLRIRRVAHKRNRQPEKTASVPLHQLMEGRIVSVLSLSQEFRIGTLQVANLRPRMLSSLFHSYSSRAVSFSSAFHKIFV